MRGRQNLWGYAFLAPQLIGLILFSLIPVLFTLTLSFMKWDGFGAKEFIGLANYIDQFQDPDFWKALGNTAYYTILVIPASIALSLSVAVALNKIKGKNFYRLFYFMPVVTSSVSIGVIWMWILNGDFGILNQVLANFGIQGPMWLTDTNWVMPSIAILSIWWGLGHNMVIFLAGLQGISKSYYEAAEIDGATKWQKLRHITLPLLSPTTFFIAIMAVISSFQVFDQAYVMTSGGPAKSSYTFVYHIYEAAFVDFKMGISSAAAMVLFVIILVFTLIQFKMSKRWVHYEDQ
ncbi:sugar ABC transporter permease [Niallia taxi]|uniref:Sugar ABC transporter permease n=1 Tax=Niallia taxi TaxID=2499688 RepID=A0A3S2UCT2_9BACI|nr:sugar ABC transporter permease [Niallia taxi]MCM3215934.1 sugar ABC transporter permease [Niallia taxi]MDK8639090.1 sugar ABC transporter permease [Niallia taxi]MED4036894.1 sugar ABC transporter permease [Niallia taxi]MED4053290.1 sugar ABC transporter permease [Niallia taxi]MED4119130.1 sugar ABC transporter permease [Niallia taxi]